MKNLSQRFAKNTTDVICCVLTDLSSESRGSEFLRKRWQAVLQEAFG